MKYFEKNRVFPVCLSMILMTVLLCFRGSKKFFEAYPSARCIYDIRIQMFLFAILGFCLIWGLYACNQDRKWIYCKGIGIGILFLAYLKIYNTIKGKVVYNISSKAGICGILLGSAVFYVLIKLIFSKREDEKTQRMISFDTVSKFRNQLMGIAMLYVMVFHMTITRADFGDGILYFLVKMGNSGVDIFVFLSGIGMTYSLSKNFDIIDFYKKRVLRIYPDYIPVVGLYSLVIYFSGLCSFGMVITNCLGISFWFSESNYAFNWYIPAMILFYIFAPVLYKLMEDNKRRNIVFFSLYFLSILFILVCYDYLKLGRLSIAFCRFPVFLIGMLIGFFLLGKKKISNSEWLSLAVLFLISLLIYIWKIQKSVPFYGGKWFPYAVMAPVFCIYISKIMGYMKEDSRILKFLSWVGKNSLLIYLFNVIFVRFGKVFSKRYIGKGSLERNLFSVFVIILNLFVVFLIIKIKAKLRWRKEKCRQQ